MKHEEDSKERNEVTEERDQDSQASCAKHLNMWIWWRGF
jgi:hypothetical protein